MATSITSIELNILKNSSLGERLRLIRRKLMDEIDPEIYTTNSISKRTGIASQTITSIERGESKKPSFNVIHTLAKEFNVSIQVFTDEYYNTNNNLFSIGPTDDVVDVDMNFDDFDSIVIGEKEYYTSDLNNNGQGWQNRRRISVIVHEKTPQEKGKLLYRYNKPMTEMELTTALSQIIQSVELNPENLSSNEWNKALKRSPLSEAHDTVSTPYNELTDIQITEHKE
ncbi:Helix-turn-helix [Lentibacillus halodurans]|uniref:Helix-turn-helix n=1 Tax=Lentibacillus halodurans TaxID=237679 RepID=A0A1I0W4Q2_9BACI|nr:helix-turn-helix transcriptional regulator [Lentibacillus halodurans]SFA83053.1 Helix-turn-helix [Lentibacillus halodurans]